ncbi:MAG: hypothetical protein DME76_00815, partial [Verrucomicrobia bacterium]
ALGFLREGNTRIPTYFVECSHGALPNHAYAIEGTKQILATGQCSLPTSIPKTRGAEAIAKAAARRVREQAAEEEALRALSRRVRGRSRAVGDIKETPLSRDEIVAGEMLLRSFLGDAGVSPAAEMTEMAPPPRAFHRQQR